MTPQSHFMVIAPVTAGREAELQSLLATMNSAPGMADPDNPLVPFARLEHLHVARFVVLGDVTGADVEAVGLPGRRFPTYLAFIGDCDGALAPFLAELAAVAGDGLGRIFAHCDGYRDGADLVAWLLARNQRPAASYVNWIGRTVREVREDSALQRALSARLDRDPAHSAVAAEELRRGLARFVEQERRAGRLVLSPPEPTPLGWRVRNVLHAAGWPLAALAALPPLVVLSPWLVYLLRSRERSDPQLVIRPDGKALAHLQSLEDHDVTNQFTAMGLVKPGAFRRWLLTVLLVGLDYGCRHIYARGFLTRVRTIHFAHWVFLDDKQRLVFASNYDGSLEAYMDDFINKVGWGLNLVFGNGVGYPRTDWLVKGGARRELEFKHFLRRHELPTEVWYKAYPGLDNVDIVRNRRIREGLERPTMSDAEAQAWVRLI